MTNPSNGPAECPIHKAPLGVCPCEEPWLPDSREEWLIHAEGLAGMLMDEDFLVMTYASDGFRPIIARLQEIKDIIHAHRTGGDIPKRRS